ncbi:hypothetical protein DTO271G3_1254 [Paecilomyces variotii]|nr:hypothetical protein DTO271G3_1254 [Paecilomyces variotii]
MMPTTLALFLSARRIDKWSGVDDQLATTCLSTLNEGSGDDDTTGSPVMRRAGNRSACKERDLAGQEVEFGMERCSRLRVVETMISDGRCPPLPMVTAGG